MIHCDNKCSLTDGKGSTYLSDHANKELTKAISILQKKMDMLEDGSISIKDINIISGNFDVLKSHLSAVIDKKQLQMLERSLSIRKKELKTFYESLRISKHFTKM